MNVTKLENVVPLPLELNEYAEATLDIFGQEARMSPIKLLKHLQNVCIVYACLAVKRNAGIVNIEAKHAAAAKAFKDIAVLGFFKWLQKNGIAFKMPWLTLDVMGRPTMSGGKIQQLSVGRESARLGIRIRHTLRVDSTFAVPHGMRNA